VMSARRMIALVVAAFALAAPSTAAAGWSDYFGPSGTFTQVGPTSAQSGWNYWTNNRVYRPTPHPFYLAYSTDPGNVHWSTTNWDTNPFYFGASGYSRINCLWEYYNDGSYSIYPVTCQGYA
jgi:hypothetical protein